MAEVEGCARVRGRCRQELQSILALMFAFVCQFYRLLCVKKPAETRHVWLNQHFGMLCISFVQARRRSESSCKAVAILERAGLIDGKSQPTRQTRRGTGPKKSFKEIVISDSVFSDLSAGQVRSGNLAPEEMSRTL